MANQPERIVVFKQPVILSYPALFKPRMKHEKTPTVLTYQATFLLPVGFDLAPLKAAMAFARANYESKKVMPPAKRIPELMDVKGNPIHKAEEKIKVDDAGNKVLPKGLTAGMHFISVHRRAEDGRPTLVDERVQPVIDENKFYAGCWVIPHLDAFVWENSGKWGVSFGLNGVQFVKDGERLGGRPDVSNQFAPIAGATPPAAAAGASAAAAGDDPFA